MNRNWMKTFGVVMLALVLIAQTTLFADSKDAKQAQKDKKADSKVQANTPGNAEQVFRTRSSKAYLRRPARRSKKLPGWSQKSSHFKDTLSARQDKVIGKEVSSQRPKEPGPTKAKRSSQKQSKKGRRLFGAIGREKKLRFTNRLKNKKLPGRVRPKLPKSTEPKITREQAEQMYQKFLSHMAEGRSRTSQAEKIKELMLKRRKQPPKQDNTTD